MGFDSNTVLFDGFAIITRTEVNIPLKDDHKALCHSVARKVTRTYSFLAFFCLDAPSLHTFCAFDSSRLHRLFLFGCSRRARAIRFGILLVLGSHIMTFKIG